MDPFTIAMLVSTAVSSVGQLFAGRAARDQANINAALQVVDSYSAELDARSMELNAYGAELNAYAIETERKLAQTQALQRHNDRLNQYRSNLSANIATFAAQGRDVGADRSIQAFLERQKEVAASDAARSDFMGQVQDVRLRMESANARIEGLSLRAQAPAERARGAAMRASAASTREMGRAQQLSSTIGAFTTLAGGLYRYNQVRT